MDVRKLTRLNYCLFVSLLTRDFLGLELHPAGFRCPLVFNADGFLSCQLAHDINHSCRFNYLGFSFDLGFFETIRFGFIRVLLRSRLGGRGMDLLELTAPNRPQRLILGNRSLFVGSSTPGCAVTLVSLWLFGRYRSMFGPGSLDHGCVDKLIFNLSPLRLMNIMESAI